MTQENSLRFEVRFLAGSQSNINITSMTMTVLKMTGNTELALSENVLCSWLTKVNQCLEIQY
jgi:hypothetical protein